MISVFYFLACLDDGINTVDYDDANYLQISGPGGAADLRFMPYTKGTNGMHHYCIKVNSQRVSPRNYCSKQREDTGN